MGTGILCNTAQMQVEPGTDISAPLQAAIDLVAEAGGGTVRLPAGRFLITAPVGVEASGVHIRGAGSDKTLLEVSSSYAPDDVWDQGLLALGRKPGGWRRGWWQHAPVITTATASLPAGTTRVPVADTDQLKAGQWVVIAQHLWPEASQRWSKGAWPARRGWPDGASVQSREFAFVYLRQVSRVGESTIVLDAPLPWPLDPANNTVAVLAPDDSAPRMVDNVGISGLRIRFADNNNGPGKRPLGTAISLEGVRNAWVHDVAIENLPRLGVLVTHSARVTVTNSRIVGAQDLGEGGWGYGFHVHSSQDVLVAGNHAAQLRHGYMVQKMTSSRIAFHANNSHANSLPDDTHYGPAQAILWDRHTLTGGTSIHLFNRGPLSNNAHETLASGIVWNLLGDDAPGKWLATHAYLGPMPDGWAALVGSVPAKQGLAVRGPQQNQQRQRLAPAKRGQTGNVWFEALQQGEVAPASLYLAQLQARGSGGVPGMATACTPVEPD